MRQKRKAIHLLCNAHLDPVWLWEWEEGAAAAISTFRTAAELCENDGAFIFNHNEVTLYKWVQEYEPALFRRIQKLVKKGLWNIMGGWYLQPDCNMPSGESFIRQILHGRNYFKRQFGVDVTTAINFDPFGHTRGLVQILAKSGFDSYLFGRPDQGDCPLPGDEFIWVGYDGSEVLGTRFCGWYNSPLGKAREKITKWLEDFPEKKVGLILWGVGNHGGGPSRYDLRMINKLIKSEKEHKVVHSTPQAYFKELKRHKDKLSRHRKDINPWAVGCYTSQVRIKQKHRRLENEIYLLEKMASAAAAAGVMSYPRDEIQEALQDLMVGEFHDILPGSSIQPVEEASLRLLDHGLEIVSRLKARAFFALSGGEPKAKKDHIPVLVYNPHPFPVKQIVECEFHLADFDELGTYRKINVFRKGRRIPSQEEKELSNLPIDWRKRVAFQAELAPGEMSRFDCLPEKISGKPEPKLKARNGKITFKAADLLVVINTRTGLVDRYRAAGVDFTAPKAFQPVVMEDNEDPWGMLVRRFTKTAGRFTLMSKKDGSAFSGLKNRSIDSVRVIEDGPVRSVVEALFSYNNSFVVQQYKLPKQGTEIEVAVRVVWNEKDRMLKLLVPVRGKDHDYRGQVACGVGDLPVNGDEAVAQKWVAVVDRKKKTALTCINDGIYGSDFSEEGLRLTLLRSPAYSCHPFEERVMIDDDRFIPRIDQGERLYHFWFNAGPAGRRLTRIDREALTRNEKPYAVSFFPSGAGKRTKPIARLSDNVIQVMAVKKAEKNNTFIIRLFEPTGRARKTVLSLPFIGKKRTLFFKKFEIKTLRINPATKRITEVDLLEKG